MERSGPVTKWGRLVAAAVAGIGVAAGGTPAEDAVDRLAPERVREVVARARQLVARSVLDGGGV